MWKTKAKILH